MSNPLAITTVAGYVWTVQRDLPALPEGFTDWHGFCAKGYATEGLAVGFIKRMAKHHGGPANWAVYSSNGRFYVAIGPSKTVVAVELRENHAPITK